MKKFILYLIACLSICIAKSADTEQQEELEINKKIAVFADILGSKFTVSTDTLGFLDPYEDGATEVKYQVPLAQVSRLLQEAREFERKIKQQPNPESNRKFDKTFMLPLLEKMTTTYTQRARKNFIPNSFQQVIDAIRHLESPEGNILSFLFELESFFDAKDQLPKQRLGVEKLRNAYRDALIAQNADLIRTTKRTIVPLERPVANIIMDHKIDMLLLAGAQLKRIAKNRLPKVECAVS